MKKDKRRNIRAVLSYVLIIALFIGAVPFPVAASGTTSSNTPIKEEQKGNPVLPQEPEQTVSQPELPPIDTKPEGNEEQVPEIEDEQQTLPQELSFRDEKGNVLESIEMQEGEDIKVKIEGGSHDIFESLISDQKNAIAISEKGSDGFYTITAIKASDFPVTITATKVAAEGYLAGEKELTISVTKKQPAEQETQEKPQKEQQSGQPPKNQESNQNPIQQLVPPPNSEAVPTPEEENAIVETLPEEQEPAQTPDTLEMLEDESVSTLSGRFYSQSLEDIDGDTLKKELRVGLNKEVLDLNGLIENPEGANVIVTVPESEHDIASVGSGNQLHLKKNGVVTVIADFQKNGYESTQDQIQIYILIEPDLQIQLPDEVPTYHLNGLPVTVALNGFSGMQSGFPDTVGSVEIYEIKQGKRAAKASADISVENINEGKIEISQVNLSAGEQQIGVRFTPQGEWGRVYSEADSADIQGEQASGIVTYSVKKAVPELEVKGITGNKLVVHENEIFHINVASTGEASPVFEEVDQDETPLEKKEKKLSYENGSFRAEKTGSTYIQVNLLETENYTSLDKACVIEVVIEQRKPVITLEASEDSAQPDGVKLKAIVHDSVSLNSLPDAGKQNYGEIRFTYQEAGTKKKMGTQIAVEDLKLSPKGELAAVCSADVFQAGTEYLVEAEYVGDNTSFYQSAVPGVLSFTRGKENPQITIKDKEGNLVGDSIHLTYTQEQTLTVDKMNVSGNSVSGNSADDDRTIVYSIPKEDLQVLTLSDSQGRPPKLNAAKTDYELEVKAGEAVHVKANQSGKSVPLCVKSKANDDYNEMTRTVIVTIEQSKTEGNYQVLKNENSNGWCQESPIIKAKETSPYNMLRYAKSYEYHENASDIRDKYSITGWSDWVPNYTVADGIYENGSTILIQMAKIENGTVYAATNDFAEISLKVDTREPSFHLEYSTQQGESILPTKGLIFNTEQLTVTAVKDDEGNISDIAAWEFTKTERSASENSAQNQIIVTAPCRAEVNVKATDEAGNIKQLDSPLEITVDNSKPSVIVSANTVSENSEVLGTYAGEWTNKNVRITLSENESSTVTSGIDHFEYSIKPKARRTENDWVKVGSENQLNISADTNEVYAFRAVSNAGVKGEPVEDFVVRVQKTAPAPATINIGNPLKEGEDWYNKEKGYPVIHIQAPEGEVNDTRAPITVCYTLTNDSDNNELTTNQKQTAKQAGKEDLIPIPITEDGIYTLCVWTEDEAGNNVGGQEKKEEKVLKVDTTVPTDITVEYSDNWFKKIVNTISFGLFYQENMTVTASANGNISGIKHFQILKYDGFNWTEGDISETGEFTIPPNEKGKIKIQCVDNAGNIVDSSDDEESGKSIEYVIDEEIPSVQIEASTYEGEDALNKTPYHQEWTNKNVSLTLSDSNEVIAGIDYYEYRFISTQEEKARPEGVEKEWKRVKESEFSALPGEPDDRVLHQNQDKENKKDSDGNDQEIAAGEESLEADGKYYVANQLRINKDTNGTYYFRAVSNTGKVSSEVAQKVYVQKTIPDHAKLTISGDAADTGWYNSQTGAPEITIDYPDYEDYQVPITVHYIFTCDRNHDGKLDEEDTNPQKEEKSFTKSMGADPTWESITDRIEQPDTSKDGVYSLEIWTTDAAGNESESHIEQKLYVDTTKPVNLEIEYSKNWFKKIVNTISFGLFYQDDITVTASADANIAGVKHFQISKDNGDTWKEEDINAGGEFTISPSLKGTVQIRVTDKAGNVSKTPDDQELENNPDYLTDNQVPSVEIRTTTDKKEEASQEIPYECEWTNQDVVITLFDSNEVIAGIDYYEYQFISTQEEREHPGGVQKQWQKVKESEFAVLPDNPNDRVEHQNQSKEIKKDSDGNDQEIAAGEVSFEESGSYYVANQLRINKDTSGTYYFRAISNTGMVSDKAAQKVYVQKTRPDNAKLTVSGKPTGTGWYNSETGAPELAVTYPAYTDYQAPITVHYQFICDEKNNGSEESNRNLKGKFTIGKDKTNNWNDIPAEIPSFDTKKDGVYTLQIWITDEAGNKSDKEHDVDEEFKVDTTPPKDMNVTYSDYSNNLFKKIIKTISFGLFYSKTMEITATSDVSISGLLYYQISKDGGKSWGENNTKDGIFKIKPTARDTNMVRVVDIAGNITTYGENPEIVVDDTRPSTTIVSRVLKSNESDSSKGTQYNTKWTNQDITLKLSDANQVIAGIDYYEYQYIPTSEKSRQGGPSEGSWKKLIELDEAFGTVVQPDKQASSERVIHETQEYEEQKGGKRIHPSEKALSGRENGRECYFVANQIRISKDTNGTYYFRAVSNTGIIGTVASQEVYIQKTIPGNASVSVDREQDATTGWFNQATRAPKVTINCPGYQSELKSYQAPMTVHYIFTYDRDNNGLDSSDVNPDEQEKRLIKGRSKESGWTEKVPLPEALDTSGDGVYTLKVWTTDEAGNRSKSSDDYERTFRVDTTNPVPAVTVSDNKWKEFFNTITFGLFFANSTEVAAMSAEDARGIFDISGRAKLEYQKVKNQIDYDTNGDWTAFGAGDSFGVSPNEKFIAYVKATDNAGNVTIINTDGVIVDDKAPTGEDYGEITITPEQANQNGFYNKEVSVGISIIDPDYWQQNLDGETGIHSGLREVSYRILNSGSTTTDWTPLLAYDNEQPSYEELQQEYKGTITVPASGNDSNEITIEVYAMDNAGNEIATSKVIQIDTTQPVIDVSYNVNTPENQTYYKTDRVATVHIRELNFNPDYVDYNITRNGESANGIAPSAGAWRSDGIDHYADIVFHEDGDYRVTLECTDQADNRSNYAVVDEFTIDETLPVIEVTYNNHNARENNYYKEDRTATIQITEHNFDSSKVQVTGTATENGTGVSFPSVGGWSSSGDVHTASISYTNDAHYTFDISYTDMAGNEAADYTEENFVLDKTKPTLTIKGTKHESANNADTIGFTIIAEDNNFGTMAPKISAIVRNEDGAFITEEVTAGEESVNGNTHTRVVENLDKDGIYSISCAVEDKAGNICDKVSLCDAEGNVYDEKEFTGTLEDVLMEFSVNREGSAYRLDLKPEDLNGKITNEEAENIQVTIEEINVDQLEDTKSRLDLYNGLEAKNIPLREGENYQVSYAQGEGGWKRYTYSLNGDNFKTDGNYKVSVYTVDKAGNQADSSLKNQSQAKLEFIIDRTKPEMTINLEDRATYNQIQRTVELNFTELHFDKDSLQIVVNKEPLKMDEDVRALEDGSYEFVLHSGINQVVDVTYQDLAGNANATTVERVTVSTSWLIRAQAFILNNLLLCIVVAAVILAAAAALVIAIIWKKRRKRIRIDGE